MTSDSRPEKPKKRVRDAEATRQKLLKVAKREFSQKGLEGARTAVIAAKAGANPNTLFHHFGSKDDLYVAVVLSLYQRNWFSESREELLKMPPLDAVMAIIDFAIDRAVNDPAYVDIMLDIRGKNAKTISQSDTVETYYDDALATVEAVLERGKQQGIFRQDIDSAWFYILLTGAMTAPNFSRQFMGPRWPKASRTESSVIADWFDPFRAFVVRGITRQD